MKIDKQQNKELDEILLQGKAPDPRTDLFPNVWRQIRTTESTEPAHTGITWMTQWAAVASALLIIAGSLFLGQHVSQNRRYGQTEVRIPTLQPQTLAGSYLTTNQGR